VVIPIGVLAYLFSDTVIGSTILSAIDAFAYFVVLGKVPVWLAIMTTISAMCTCKKCDTIEVLKQLGVETIDASKILNSEHTD